MERQVVRPTESPAQNSKQTKYNRTVQCLHLWQRWHLKGLVPVCFLQKQLQ